MSTLDLDIFPKADRHFSACRKYVPNHGLEQEAPAALSLLD
jgi:hypothetical protein